MAAGDPVAPEAHTQQTNDTMATKPTPKSQLSKGMEHIRYAVTADPIPKSQPDSLPETDAYGVPASIAPIRNPAARSHSPSNNQKRTDPFAFGSRYLEEGDDIFEFNAWDHVEVDASYRDFTASQYEKQRADPVTEFDKKRFNDNPEKWWNLFYKNNKNNFFKNRKWLAQEFPILNEVTKEDSPPATLLECGAGAGNTAFPILAANKNPKLKIHACDFSKTAVEVIRNNPAYESPLIQSDVWDVAASPESENGGLPPGLTEGSVDVVLMIFIFSALSPKQWNQAVRNIWRVLKPGGQVLFRDYGRGDLAQVRFKKGRWMEENFYVRGDGTRVYFFEKEELEEIWGGKTLPETKEVSSSAPAAPTEHEEASIQALGEQVEKSTLEEAEQSDAKDNLEEQAESQQARKRTPREEDPVPTPEFEVVHFGVDRRMLVNRQRRLKMYRCWMQAVFRKPESAEGISSEIATSTIKQDKGPKKDAVEEESGNQEEA